MTANEISYMVNNGNGPQDLSSTDFSGHVGVLIAHAFLHDIPMEADILARYLKIDVKDIETPLKRLSNYGIFTPYGWLTKSKNNMIRMPSRKLGECLESWTHIAAIAAGYIEPIPNTRYMAASHIYHVATGG